MIQLNAKRIGQVAVVTGPGFEFKKVGDRSAFKQSGKIPSIRAARVFCKLFTA
ncbi:hypothetical protein [Pseudomonas sp.]|uniref:hypothetical protein n=1 Tax=Pseudomonas sp. TaxID=306 RepID=UPI00262FA288|nr:hypothetical protein [Pseudomonas sp.]